jgi:hypothetical protein
MSSRLDVANKLAEIRGENIEIQQRLIDNLI